ncbi:MAG TPA: dihydrolipoamide acetyltransferase family protein [Burkholderiales bacterium]|nr:dihydrolipoamide acetyltransferase family protein [Burkholderiales bacterium]
MYEFCMPSLGADMDAGTLVEWMVKPGDSVRRGQVVAVVETQKGAIEVEIWQSGTVDRLLVGPGTKVPVGARLALVATEEEVPASAATVAPAPPPSQPAPRAPAVRSEPAAAVTRVRISPAARRRAEELGLDISRVQPAEPGGTVSLTDVERSAKTREAPHEAAPPAPPGGDWHAQMRQAIANAMSRSKREIPHYYLVTQIDVSRMSSWLTAENLKRPVALRLLPVVPLMKATALALCEVPELNGVWRDGAFHPSSAVHLGMAIAMRGGGLVAPAIHDAERKSLDELMASLRDLITRVRGGRLRSSEMSDPTVTLTNLGDQGVEQVLGVIYPPQAAIIGMGKIAERPWIDNGAVVARKILIATLSADHRVSDGHRGALFLSALDRLLQEPEKLL